MKSQEGKAVEEACKKSYTDLNINNFTVTPTASQISDSSATVSKTQKSMVCFSKNDDANDKDKPGENQVIYIYVYHSILSTILFYNTINSIPKLNLICSNCIIKDGERSPSNLSVSYL